MIMMKNFTKILGLLALAAPLSTNAMEWREVSKTDFGGNDTESPIICKTEPSANEMETDLNFYTWSTNYEANYYMIIKATQLADVGKGYNLTNWGTVLPGSPTWIPGGDHTNPDDPNSGYYMAFDCPAKSEVKLYKNVQKVSCAGVEFKLEAYFAVLDNKNTAANTVCVSIEAGGKVLNTATLASANNTTWANPGNTITWVPLSTTFKLDDSSISSVDFVVKALDCASTGWDIAMDDITISVNQPTVTINTQKYFYKEPAKLATTYNQTEFDAFFGDAGSEEITYKWYFCKNGKFDGSEELVYTGTYTSGKDISYTIPSFVKEENNGTYRIIIATKGNENSNLCSIQKDVVVNQEKNEVNVTICEDSTKVILGNTLTPKKGIATESVVSDDKSVIFNITNIMCDKSLDPVYISQCLNQEYPTAGDIELDDIVEKDTNNCPITLQKQYLRVKEGNVKDQPKHICEGDKYITDDNVAKIYDEVDESKGTLIEFDEDGCRHEQLVFVHPKKNTTEDVVVCKGDSYQGIPYNTPSSTPVKGTPTTYKTIWGCDSVFTPMITVVAPVLVEKELVACPKDSTEFDGKVFTSPIDTVLSVVETGSNGCDSTTTLHLVVMDGGVIYKDTLICREQILWAGTPWEDSFMVASYNGLPYPVTHSGTTASGCEMDTVWNVYVVDIVLNLRMTGDQHDICKGQEVTLNARWKTNDPKGRKLDEPTIYWVPEVTQNILNPTMLLNESTTFTIYADLDLPSDVDKDAKGCHASASWDINIHPMPELTIDTVIAEERAVEYTVTDGTMPYHMYLEAKKDKKKSDDRNKKDLDIQTTNTGKLEKLAYGEHILSVVDSTGCTAEAEFKLEAIQPEPSPFFTPNHDGENDLWVVKNLDVYPKATVKVFDRYGKLIISGTGENFTGWDGNYNGNKMPATDYWYEINIDDIDRQYYGHFTLMR